jgi:hypothetical protein
MTHSDRLYFLDRAKMHRDLARELRSQGKRGLARCRYLMAVHCVEQARIASIMNAGEARSQVASHMSANK